MTQPRNYQSLGKAKQKQNKTKQTTTTTITKNNGLPVDVSKELQLGQYLGFGLPPSGTVLIGFFYFMPPSSDPLFWET